MNAFNNIYKNKKVLITGHTGFKGSWLAIWLHELGAKVIGYALEPYTEKDNFVLSQLSEKIIDIRGDIRDSSKLQSVFETYQPEFIFHLAAQPLVKYSYKAPHETFEVNVMGTINVLEAIRNTPSVKVGIMVTTDKCYDNKEQIWGYRESDPMGGYDPYSSSKGATELAINSWRLSFMNPESYEQHGKSIASVRAGNVIGGGDWAKDRIIPDCIKAFEQNQTVKIRSPKAIRPWEHVLEPLSGYLLLGEKMYNSPKKYAEAWNFGPESNAILPVWSIAESLCRYFDNGRLEDHSNPNAVHEAKLLMLDISKARYVLGWQPTLNIDETIAFTAKWYSDYHHSDVYKLCKQQITDFSRKGEYI